MGSQQPVESSAGNTGLEVKSTINLGDSQSTKAGVAIKLLTIVIC